MFVCAAAERDITPPLNRSIPGYFQQRLGAAVKDPLCVRAVAVGRGSGALILLSADALMLEAPVVSRIKDGIFKEIGVKPDSVLVAATHTHTGGPVQNFAESRRDEDYIDRLVISAVEAAKEAHQRREPALLRTASGRLPGIAFNRRYVMRDGTVTTNPDPEDPRVVRPEGPADDSLTLAEFVRPDGSPIAVVYNFACHLDTVDGDGISADYIGEVRKMYREKYGERFVALFLLGAAGNLNHFNRGDPRTYHDREYYKQIGRRVFERLEELRPQAVSEEEPGLSVRSGSFTVGLRHPTGDQFAEAERIVARGEGAGYVNTVMKSTELGFAKELLTLRGDTLAQEELFIQLIRLGRLTLAAWPGEMFCEFALRLREKVSGPVIVATLANGTGNCYIPTVEAFKNGGYEPRMTGGVNLQEGAGEIILARTLDLLD